MRNKLLLGLFGLIIAVLLFMPNKAFASSSGYEIEDYNIDITVNEDNTYDIKEEITANFLTEKHGIFRKIPIHNSVKRQDGSSYDNYARITNIKVVGGKYTTSVENNYKVIKIGDADKTLVGEQKYTISYKYDIGPDKLEDADEFYLNIIGTEWDTEINHVSFTIKMPKAFDEEKLGFSTGSYSSTGSDILEYSVDENTIIGSTTAMLNAGEGLTIRLELPEGYFDRVDKADLFTFLFTGLCVSIVIYAFYLWKTYGKDDIAVETVEFYPPEGYNSAETQFLYKGDLNNKGIISLLIYLADKGYLKIEEIKKEGVFADKNDFKIIKLKDYDGNDESERIFFDGLFKYGKNVATKSSLKDSFYTTVDRVRHSIVTREFKDKIFERTAKKKSFVVIGMIFLILVLLMGKIGFVTGDFASVIGGSIFPIIGISVISLLFMEPSIIENKSRIFLNIFMVAWGAPFIIVPIIVTVFPAMMFSKSILICVISAIVAIAVLIVFLKIMPKRTKLGTEMLGKIGGFKRFLETAEKDELESLVEKDPQYFYNILPYTYALGVSDKWVKKFETIAVEPPSWYEGYDTFNMLRFSSFMTNTMTAASTAMTSSPASTYSGGSGGGGGGFSGGGSGGGGGGSW